MIDVYRIDLLLVPLILTVPVLVQYSTTTLDLVHCSTQGESRTGEYDYTAVPTVALTLYYYHRSTVVVLTLLVYSAAYLRRE